MTSTVKRVYYIANIEEYGKFISYCIENDVNVFRTYWDEREKKLGVIALIFKRSLALILLVSIGKCPVIPLLLRFLNWINTVSTLLNGRRTRNETKSDKFKTGNCRHSFAELPEVHSTQRNQQLLISEDE